MNRHLHPLITWLPSRTTTSLNGEWRAIIDVYDIALGGIMGGSTDLDKLADTSDAAGFGSAPFGFYLDRGRDDPGRRAEYDFTTSPVIEVPGDWSTQHERFHFYEGAMWFRRRFATPDAAGGTRTFLYVGAANHEAIVFLNKRFIAQHEGGFGPFCMEVTDKLAEGDENSLVIQVNNRRQVDGIPTTRTDWFNYGGLTRDVMLLHVPGTFIRDAVVQLDPNDIDTITVEVELDGPDSDQQVQVEVDGSVLGSVDVSGGTGSARFPRPDGVELWSPTSPSLHEVTLRTATDEVTDRIGFRTLGTSGSTILLNGEPIFLAGISLHDEAIAAEAHRIRTPDEAREILGHAKELGSVFVRLAHYQHNEHTVRMCDELGLLAWCELPVYWGIAWENEATLANARDQLRELVVRDRNRAAVALWSMANETPPNEARTTFLRTLIDDARELDPTRLITAALFARPADGDFMSMLRGESRSDTMIDDPLGEYLDVLGVNQYHGWYYGNFDHMAGMDWVTPYDKPLLMTEFGGGARHGLRGDKDESWTEDLQAEIYRNQFEMLARIPFLAGTSPWILKDFRAPFRLLPEVQDGYNRKGLIDHEGNRKLAFDIVAEWNRSKTQ